MNSLEPHELFFQVGTTGAKKVVFERDTKIRNAGTFAIEKEDHTIGNSVRAQLLKRRSVLFAGYKMPHPLEHRIVIKVQTDLDTTPQNEMQESIHELIQDLLELEQQFRDEVKKSKTGDEYPHTWYN